MSGSSLPFVCSSLRVLTFVFGLVASFQPTVLAQLPSLPLSAKPTEPPRPDPSVRPVPTKDNSGAVFAATSGPIKVEQKVDDNAVRTTIDELVSQYPGVRKVEAFVKDGVVRLEGHVDDDDSLNDVTEFTKKVEGVRLVLNRMQTDAELLSGRQMAQKELANIGQIVSKNWLLAIVAIVFGLGFAGLARVFSRYSETILSPFVGNVLLRSVLGSLIGSVIVVLGVIIGLSVLHLTHAVVSVLGLAGVVGLALGFAFRDIAENFIASMLLGVRRPFQIGDFITVAGKSGSVLSLNTRATVLITPEGNHVQIPNAVIYKETLVNASTSPSSLNAIEVMVPYEASTAEALDAINDALRSADGLLPEPAPRTLVAALESNGIRLKATFWLPIRGIDGDKVQSDLRLKIKVALQKAGITPPANYANLSITGKVPVEILAPKPNGSSPRDHETTLRPGVVVSTSQVEENLRKDVEAADNTTLEPADTHASPIEHAIKQAEAEAAAEGGGNLLVNGKA